jgi:hypothetical protein
MTSDEVGIQENILLNRWRRLTKIIRSILPAKIEGPTLLDLVNILPIHRECLPFPVEVVLAFHHRLALLRPRHHHYLENATSSSLPLVASPTHLPFSTTLPTHLSLVPAFWGLHLWVVLEAGTHLGLIKLPYIHGHWKTPQASQVGRNRLHLIWKNI